MNAEKNRMKQNEQKKVFLCTSGSSIKSSQNIY